MDYQSSARQRRAELAKQRLEGLLNDALNILHGDPGGGQARKSRSRKKRVAAAASGRTVAEGGLSVQQLDQLVETLQFAKHAALLALDMDGGKMPQPQSWIETIKAMVSVIAGLYAVTVPDAPPGVVGYQLWPLNDGDVLEYAGKVCRMHPSLRASLKRLIPFEGLRCSSTVSSPGGAQTNSMSSNLGAGGELLRDAPVQAASTPREESARGAGSTEQQQRQQQRQQQLQQLERELGARLPLITHQLWPTLVSTLNIGTHKLGTDARFLERLNRAALAGYSSFQRTDRVVAAGVLPDTASRKNGRFFEWQTRGSGGGLKLERLPLSAADRQLLRDIAVHSCMAHILQHRGVVSSLEDELGYPEPEFVIWASVLGDEAENLHSPHAHLDSVCSGVLYSRSESGASILESVRFQY
jgi:hypothetical protein